MARYTKHLEQMYTDKTFGRKVEYLKYNLRGVLPKTPPSDFSVLEVGPGMGEGVWYLNNLGVKNIDVIDNDIEILKSIKKRYKIRNAILETKHAYQNGKLDKYDLITMIQVLEHIDLERQPKFINMLYSHLKRGGKMVIVVPNANNPLGLTERYGDKQHTCSFTTRSSNDLILDSGITGHHLTFRGFEIPPYSLINVLRISLQKLLHLILLFVMVINGGVYYLPLTPNLMIILEKK